MQRGFAFLAGASGVRRVKVVLIPWVRDPSWKAVGRQEAIEADREVTNGREPSMERTASGSSASCRAITRVNVEQAPKTLVAEADPPTERGRPCPPDQVNRVWWVPPG